MNPGVQKSNLLCTRLPYHFCCANLLIPENKSLYSEKHIRGCGRCYNIQWGCGWLSKICYCGQNNWRFLTLRPTLVNPNLDGKTKDGGTFVKKRTKLMVTDEMVVTPLMNHPNLDKEDLEEIEPVFGKNEFLSLLKAILTSKSVLSDVFTKKKSMERPNISTTAPKALKISRCSTVSKSSPASTSTKLPTKEESSRLSSSLLGKKHRLASHDAINSFPPAKRPHSSQSAEAFPTPPAATCQRFPTSTNEGVPVINSPPSPIENNIPGSPNAQASPACETPVAVSVDDDLVFSFFDSMDLDVVCCSTGYRRPRFH
ncbi:hypothetical protein QJS10_CPA03g01473 [Acorus calamus]|uniref:Uncharacterized protein n=1 Tax=Acorus calamus TaxID=4465 RepID=A0AAV9F574_ACOCL|nr:hypothetical protein QJS10_CPA03g01473 [Acorus calamus]